MKILLTVLSITILYQVWGIPKHFLIETEDDHEEPKESKENHKKEDVPDYSYDGWSGDNQGTDYLGKAAQSQIKQVMLFLLSLVISHAYKALLKKTWLREAFVRK